MRRASGRARWQHSRRPAPRASELRGEAIEVASRASVGRGDGDHARWHLAIACGTGEVLQGFRSWPLTSQRALELAEQTGDAKPRGFRRAPQSCGDLAVGTFLDHSQT